MLPRVQNFEFSFFKNGFIFLRCSNNLVLLFNYIAGNSVDVFFHEKKALFILTFNIFFSQARLCFFQEYFQVSVVKEAESPVYPNAIILECKFEILQSIFIEITNCISLYLQVFAFSPSFLNKIFCWLNHVSYFEKFYQNFPCDSAYSGPTIERSILMR